MIITDPCVKLNWEVAQALGWKNINYNDPNHKWEAIPPTQRTWRELPRFSSSFDDAFTISATVRKMGFSRRMIFKEELQKIVSARIGVEVVGGNLLCHSEIVIFLIPADICNAFLAIKRKRGDSNEVVHPSKN